MFEWGRVMCNFILANKSGKKVRKWNFKPSRTPTNREARLRLKKAGGTQTDKRTQVKLSNFARSRRYSKARVK